MRVHQIHALFPALLLVVGLFISAGIACDRPAGANPPASGGAASSGGGPGGVPAGGAASQAGGGGGEAAAPSEPAPPPCEPALDDQPTAFFGGRFLMRMPKGTELVEQNPFFARSSSGGQMSSCGVPVPFEAVGFLRSSSAVPLVRKHVLMLRGLDPDALTMGPDQTQGETTITSYEAGAGSRGEPPLKGLVLIRRDRGWFYWALLEAAPDDFPKVEQLFRASFASLIVRPVRD